jgi:hypothetical protein
MNYTENDFKASVGKYGPTGTLCYNTLSDQQMIQDLLNAIPKKRGGAEGTLKGSIQWKKISDELYKAIRAFQNAHTYDGLSVDGHVDPHQQTLRLMLKLSKEFPPAAPSVVPRGSLFISPDLSGSRKGPDWADDSNHVVAANRFRIRMLGGMSGGVGPGPVGLLAGSIMRFQIWDIVNDRSAEYRFLTPIVSIGTPLSLSFAGAWSVEFSPPKWIQVDQFEALADYVGAGAGPYGHMTLTLLIFSPFSGKCAVNVPTGFSAGGGLETSPKPSKFSLVSGSVQVFKG